tara:strand:+ start:5330 stop:6091 length:762 start_codon:yes stop_codon:yes gene_type:complete
MKKLLEVPWITHTHHDCSDLWVPYISEMKLFMPLVFEAFNHIYMVNASKNNTYAEETFGNSIYYYDENIAYPSRILNILRTLQASGHKYVIIDHEDMFLFDYPQLFIIDDAFKLMVKNSIDCIKFSKSTNCLASKDPECDDLMHISLNSDWIFSVQPSIWKISSYIKILEHYPQVNIWQLETLAQDIVKEYKLDICYLSGIGQKRGLYHYDSSIYPYIATALFKGKWVVNEYPNELQEIFVRYNINPYIRGFA